jgi:hypothetical protein
MTFPPPQKIFLMDQLELRAFFYSLFGTEANRMALLKRWHSNYSVNVKEHERLSSVFQQFIEMILFEPVRFRVRYDHFNFFGAGCDQLRVLTKWLPEVLLSTLRQRVLKNKQTLFEVIRKLPNKQFSLVRGGRYPKKKNFN